MTSIAIDLATLDADAVLAGTHDPFLDALDDDALFEAAAAVIAEPRAAPADSFVLHAPLEMLARRALLDLVPDQHRRAARRRIAWVAASYAATGPPYRPLEGAAQLPLADAIARGDLDATDTAARALATSGAAMGTLADTVVPSLAAAAHGGIYLNLVDRVAPASATARLMVRPLARELARNPDWRLRWIDERPAATEPTDDLVERLLRPAPPPDPGSKFIYPTMSAVDRAGFAPALLDSATADLGVEPARRALLRVAAWSMLQDTAADAAYGWTHCLTMAQATLAIADQCRDPGRAVAVAATYVLGFRATLGTVDLDPAWAPPAVDGDRGWLDRGAYHAAAVFWHAEPDTASALSAEVLTAASLHHDAHVAKYVLACHHASLDDPDAGPLFGAAAAYLIAHWRANPDLGFD